MYQRVYCLGLFSQTDSGTGHTAAPAPATPRGPEIRGQVTPLFAQVMPDTSVDGVLTALKSQSLLLDFLLMSFKKMTTKHILAL